MMKSWKFGAVKILKFHLNYGNVVDSYYLSHAQGLDIFTEWAAGTEMAVLKDLLRIFFKSGFMTHKLLALDKVGHSLDKTKL